MKPILMIKLCNNILHKLENIESEAVSLSPKQLKWLYSTMRSVNELKNIAKYETDKKMTPFQVDHINLLKLECSAAKEDFTSSDNADD